MDAVLDQVGHFGWYQLRLFILIVFPVMSSAAYHSQYVFNAGDLKYRCFVPECEKRPGTWKPGVWADWALVAGSSCTRRKPIGGNKFCERKAFSESTLKCDAWVYESNNTIVAEFNLACKDWKRTLVGTIHSLGVFTALIFIGIVSDTIGRRNTFLLTSTCGAVMGMIRSFATSYIFYVIFEYLDATFGAGVYSTGFILIVEMVGKSRRVLCGSVLASLFAMGLVILASLAWAVPYWRTFTRILYAPAVIYLSYFFCLSESVRWLISKDKKDKAIKVLKNVATMNGRRLSENTINNMTEFMVTQKENVGKKSVWRQVLHSRILLTRVVICSCCWMTVTFVYYGLSINSVSLMGNKYINYILTALVEIPGYALSNFMLDRFGRKRSIMAALVICGLTLFLIPVIPDTFDLLPNLVAKCCISIAFVSIYIFTMELFPTSARHSLLSACSLIGRVGSISAPQTPLLLKIKLWLPYVLFGSVCCIAAMLLTLTPETLRKPMPETVTQAENIYTTPQMSPEEAKNDNDDQTAAKSTSTSPVNSSPASSKALRAEESKGEILKIGLE